MRVSRAEGAALLDLLDIWEVLAEQRDTYKFLLDASGGMIKCETFLRNSRYKE